MMCWRGGERSRNVSLLLALVGIHVVTVKGGYRAYRKEVLSGLAALAGAHAGLHALRTHRSRQERDDAGVGQAWRRRGMVRGPGSWTWRGWRFTGDPCLEG